jgi:predicted translin family RNA/ssDNA-binding protein
MLVSLSVSKLIRRVPPCPNNFFNTAFSSTKIFSYSYLPTSKSFSSTTVRLQNMPEPFYTHGTLSTSPALDLSELGVQIASEDERRHASSDLSRRLQVAYNAAKEAIDFNLPTQVQTERFEKFKMLLKDPLIEKTRQNRPGHLSSRLEDYTRLCAMVHFLQTGQLWPLPTEDDSAVTDEEYLAGACMGLAQDLQRYGLGRATIRDVKSVTAAKDLVRHILDFLVQIDFRNGPLRRKYDGVKYSLQGLERLLYELAVTDGNPPPEPDAKNTKVEKEETTTPAELMVIKERMDYRDELREKLIKRCRDGQKAAKQAIFALHRGDRERAESLMDECEACIRALIPTIEEEPPLRSGSFANMLEEYVEAKLFAAWLDPISPDSETAAGEILSPSDFGVIALLPDEYLGGLCDLTGEIGRYAVHCGTKRDVDGVRLCLHSNQQVLSAIQSLPVFPSGIGKKMDQLRRSIEKLERILYELSLSEAAGGRPVQTEVEGGEQNEGNP